MKRSWRIIKGSVSDFFEYKILKLSASLAFFTIFSLPGLLIIILWVSQFFHNRQQVESGINTQLEQLMGHDAALSIQEAITNATSSASTSRIAALIGGITLIVGATSIFIEIQDSINMIWQLRYKSSKGFGILKMLLNRLLSFSMIITLGFILLVSLFINGALDIFLNSLIERYPDLTVVLMYMVNIIISLLVTMVIFAAIFKMLPDAKVKWANVWTGAFVTAIFFVFGRFLISFYLGHSRISTTYGAAGSLIVVLLWVYYSAIILYFGAVFTHAYVKEMGGRIHPNSYAVWVKEVEIQPS